MFNIPHSGKAPWVGVMVFSIMLDMMCYFAQFSLISSLSMSLFSMPFIVLLLLFAIIDDKSW